MTVLFSGDGIIYIPQHGPEAPKPLIRMSLVSNEHTYFLKTQIFDNCLRLWVIALAYNDEMVHHHFWLELKTDTTSYSFRDQIAPIDSDPETYMKDHSYKIPMDSVLGWMWNEDKNEFSQLTYSLKLG